MEKAVLHHFSMGIIGGSIGFQGIATFFREGYSISVLLMMVGGIGLVGISGYGVVQDTHSEFESRFWWISASCAVLVLLGTILRFVP